MSIENTTSYMVAVECKETIESEEQYKRDTDSLFEAVHSVLQSCHDPMQCEKAWTKPGLLDLDCEFTVSLTEKNTLSVKIYISLTAEQKMPFNKAMFKSTLLEALVDPKWNTLTVYKNQVPNVFVPE